jgi:hypothetical protein
MFNVQCFVCLRQACVDVKPRSPRALRLEKVRLAGEENGAGFNWMGY